MTDNRNEVAVDNSVLILIDHQPWSLSLSTPSTKPSPTSFPTGPRSTERPRTLRLLRRTDRRVALKTVQALGSPWSRPSPRARPARRTAPNTSGGGSTDGE